MKFWNNVDGSIFLNKVFSTLIPIGSIELFAINIDNNRNNINIGFDIDEIPDIIPAKWLKNEFNTCRIGLDCGEIKNLSIKNIPTTKKLYIKIIKYDTHYLVHISNDESLIEFTANYISLGGPSVYFNTERS